tara:strand:+ start:769 stop:1374 length:606 start_codon:yes stop_codon:yes gene_type:complete
MALNFAKNNSLSAVTALPASISGGGLNLISTQTASSSATIDFTSGIDSTYKEYIFKFYDVHPATDGQNFTFQADTGTNTNYNQTVTNTFFYADHSEADATNNVVYNSGRDQAQGTSFIQIAQEVGNDNDQSCVGTLHLFDPSNTTFVKHFISRTNCYLSNNFTQDTYVAGYFNTTTAITRVQFKFASGNIDSGTIKLYGVT